MGSLSTEYLTQGLEDEFHPDKWKPDSSAELPARCAETHLNVLIVGAGPSGLMTALECWRRGHNVVGILERSSGPVYAGWFTLPILLKSTTNVEVTRRHHYCWTFRHRHFPSLAGYV